MVRVAALSSPFLLGFDEIERALDKVTKAAADGYPPYNIERIAASDAEPEMLRITLGGGRLRPRPDRGDAGGEPALIRGRQQEDKTRNICIAGSPRGSSSVVFFSPTGWRSLARNLPTAFCRSIWSVRSQSE